MKPLLFLLACSSISLSVHSQIITTIAGNGTHGYSGDGGPATAAQISGPAQLALFAQNLLFEADDDNSRIREIDLKSDTITTYAGNGCGAPYTGCYGGDGGLATDASLYLPFGVATDYNGNVFIADYANGRIRKVDVSTKIITTIAGTGAGYSGDGGQASIAGIGTPYGIAIDYYNNIYFVEDSRVRKITNSTGIITTIAGNDTAGFRGDGGPATAALLANPLGIASDATGNIYIADVNNNRIRMITATTGIITTIAGNGVSGYGGDGGPATAASLGYPECVGVDKTGNVFIPDYNNSAIREVYTGNGIIKTIAGNGKFGYSGDGGPATNAELAAPIEVIPDTSGNIYISDRANQVIRKVTGIPIGIDEINPNKHFILYPNPFTNYATITFDDNSKHYLELIDITGRKLKQMEVTENKFDLQRQDLSNGIYIVNIYSSTKTYLSSLKVIIQ
ncbi:MAG TPA: T9SS type A sorting domain-containing protein [Bacteroidia bacterium]|jgi:hypothetical protein|nr:T9SS type A sorting domain-containing protein [Bacteroidia bacterium]